MTSFPFEKLPVALYQEIQLFLAGLDYIALMNASKHCFDMIKYETVKVTIRSREMDRFIFDMSFKERILSLMKDPSFQLKLVYTVNEPPDIPVLQLLLRVPCSKLVLKNSGEFLQSIQGWNELLCQRRSVSLDENSKIASFDGLLQSNLQILKLKSFSALTEVSHLSSLQELVLQNCHQISSVHCLSRLKKLSIEHCHEIEDISSLGHIPDLTILYCHKVEKIACLTHNLRLRIGECSNVKDLKLFKSSHLKYLETNLISHYQETTHFPNLRHVILCDYKEENGKIHFNPLLYYLELYFAELNDTTLLTSSPLSSLHSLTLGECHNLNRLSGLGAIACLEIMTCYLLNDISDLENGKANRSVYIEDCPELGNFSALKNIHKVAVKMCDGFANGKDVENVHHLIIDRCSNLKNISMLGKIGAKLELRNCFGVTSLEGLRDVPNILIENCKNLKMLRGLKNNEMITLCRFYNEYEEKEELWYSDEEKYLEDKDNDKAKTLQNHPLVNDILLKSCYQLIDITRNEFEGKITHVFAKKRNLEL
jgi:hypothetical protein